MTVGALVVGGDYQGLGIVRSLGRRGIPVCVVDDELSIARFSRYATHSIRVPDLRDERRFVATMKGVAQRLGLKGWVLYPTREEQVVACARHRSELETVLRVPTPGWEVVRWAWDKRNTYRLAGEVGVDAPRTWYPESEADLDTVDTDAPLVIKPAIKENFFYATGAKAWRADTRSQLVARFAQAARIVPPGEVIVQELIPADGEHRVAFCALFKGGRPLAHVSVRRLRQHPPEFGRASTLVETVDIPELEPLATRFLAHIGYYGLVEVEFVLDSRDGRYKLLDVNARTWGYHTIGAAAGVDFSALLFADQMGEPVSPSRGRADVRWIRVLTDTPTALHGISSGQLGVGEYLRSIRGLDVEAVLARDDPAPFFAELGLLPYLSLRKGF